MCGTVVRLTFQRANVKNIGAYRRGKKGIQKAKERNTEDKRMKGNGKRENRLAPVGTRT